jgi:SARP family transcriptional regulator, regulator of embCAB operon
MLSTKGATSVEIRVLGPLVAHHKAAQAVPSAGKPRKVLALLLLNEQQMVPASALLSELWDDKPPRSAMTTLQTYVLHLRKLFADTLGLSPSQVAKQVLQTRNTGYLISAGDAALDLREYRRLEQAGLSALQCGDDTAAVETFDRALRLWQGSVLSDVEHGRLLEAEAARLEQSRLTMVEYQVEAKLRLGRHRESLSGLAGLVVLHRFHENLHAQYMLALHRSGCRTRALEVYHRLRVSMIDELGLEPSPKLQWLHHAMLTADPQLDDLRRVPELEMGVPRPRSALRIKPGHKLA